MNSKIHYCEGCAGHQHSPPIPVLADRRPSRLFLRAAALAVLYLLMLLQAMSRLCALVVKVDRAACAVAEAHEEEVRAVLLGARSDGAVRPAGSDDLLGEPAAALL